MKHNDYSPIIGLEVHVELKTKSKMFCGCSADHFRKEPNTQVCPICLGLPGALPVPNKKAIEWCVMIGLALNCKIPLLSKFDRKNYFYPDLPKGYQISQYDQPFSVNGHIVIASKAKQSQTNGIAASPTAPRNNNKVIRIRRVHMEEDTAKLTHHGGSAWYTNEEERGGMIESNPPPKVSFIDFNRSGVPLVEIVTEPDFENVKDVVEYLKKLQQIVRYLGVSDADMEKGQMRLEPNISLKPVILGSPDLIGTTPESPSFKVLGDSGRALPRLRSGSLARMTKTKDLINKLPQYKVEVKNINSFRFVEKAINYEIERQRKILESAKTPIQETRGWDENQQATVSQRVKEEAMDYRYFPEPDVPPIRFAQYQISNIKNQIGELPDAKLLRFQKEYGLSEYDSEILTRERFIADYFEEAIRASREVSSIKYKVLIKNIANCIINKKIDINKTLPAELAQVIVKDAQKSLLDNNKLNAVIIQVLSQNQKAVEDYKRGKVQAIGFLLGKAKQHFLKVNINQLKTVLEKYLRTK